MTRIGEALHWIEDQMGFKPRAIFLDYLQLMQSESDAERRLQISENINRSKDMAIAMGCPVIMGVQAAREVDSRSWKLPQLRDGQESSSVEQVADKMLSVWMPKTTEKIGELLAETGRTVTENLLVMSVIKQKLGPAGEWWGLYVDPTRNEIAGMAKEVTI